MNQVQPFKKIISSEEELRDLTGYPSELVRNKVIDFLDVHCRTFISLSPFLTISTADQSGYCDVSPRGDGPGFVQVLDDKHLVIPERPGNRRLDSAINILSNPHVGLLFLIPGLGETLRINGKASLVQDDELLEKMAVNGKKPIFGIAVEVSECFIHCAKAFKRSGLWEPESWLDKGQLPSAGKMLRDHSQIPSYSSEDIEEMLKESYKKLY